MSSHSCILQLNSPAVLLIELIKQKEEMLTNYRNAESKHLQDKAHKKYFEVENELKKILENKSIAKLFGVAKIPSKIMIHPSRGPALNETCMAIYEYTDPYTNTLEMVAITYDDEDDEDDENEDDENEDDEKEDDEKEDDEKEDE